MTITKEDKIELVKEIKRMIDLHMLPIKTLTLNSGYKDGFIEACSSIKRMLEIRYEGE